MMCAFRLVAFALSLQSVVALRSVSQACVSEDLAARSMMQNQLAGICENMCKDVGSYPKCECPNYVDKTDTALSALQHKARVVKALQVSKSCMSEDLKER